MRLSVVIPSRLAAERPADPASRWFVERAIACVRGQTLLARPGWSVQIVIGVDPGMAAAGRQRLDAAIDIAEAPLRLQAEALNAALARVDGDVVALLEDDDLWAPDYLALAVDRFERVDFVSSTQLERMVGDDDVVGILDYPTPSSWVMKRAILDRVGGFDASYRWHLDSEWLGRLGEIRAPRVHLVEATAPVAAAEITHSRQMLMWMLERSNNVTIERHDSPWPKVFRTRHPGSGMAKIRDSEELKKESDAEYERMKQRYGHVPW